MHCRRRDVQIADVTRFGRHVSQATVTSYFTGNGHLLGSVEDRTCPVVCPGNVLYYDDTMFAFQDLSIPLHVTGHR